jgi:hypothetical protein
MRKNADVHGYFYGIERIETGRNSSATSITHMHIVTGCSGVRLVASDDDCAREMIAQLRAALDEWEALLPVEQPEPRPAGEDDGPLSVDQQHELAVRARMSGR